MHKSIITCHKCDFPIYDDEIFGITEDGNYIHYTCGEVVTIVEIKGERNLPKKENDVIIKETE